VTITKRSHNGKNCKVRGIFGERAKTDRGRHDVAALLKAEPEAARASR